MNMLFFHRFFQYSALSLFVFLFRADLFRDIREVSRISLFKHRYSFFSFYYLFHLLFIIFRDTANLHILMENESEVVEY